MVGLAPQRERYPEIDRLKAAAILGVIWIHCFNEWGWPRSDFARLSSQITSAAVPAFFFASGLLNYSATRYPRGTLRRWALRLLPPYLVGSLGALVFFAVRGRSFTLSEALFDLAVGDLNGIYYFIFVLWECLFLSLALARVRWLAPALFPLFALGPLLQGQGLDPVLRVFDYNLLAQMRSPFTWLGYYLGGWLAARWRDSIPWQPVGIAAGSVWLAICALPYLDPSSPALSGVANVVLGTLQVFAAILAILGLARGPRISKPVLWLSKATYALFLWHVYVVVALKPSFDGSEGGRLLLFFLTLGITGAAIAALRALAPRASRLLLGA